MNKNPIITGTQINYYFVCKRKLWLFSKNITMEQNSELVEIGSLIHNSTYKRKKKEIQFDGIKIDFFEKNSGMIHEVKKSKAVKISAHWQMKYYLYYFKNLGLDFKGEINYPLLRRFEKISLSNEDIIKIEEIINEIRFLKNSEVIPNNIDSKICKKCSYYELCYI